MKHQNEGQSVKIEIPGSGVSILSVTQATAATFTDLYFTLTFLFFIQTGSKRVICPTNGEVIGEAGDVMIFPPGSVVTMENRPILNAGYRADGVCFTHDLVDMVFAEQPPRSVSPGIQVLGAASHRPSEILDLIKETLNREGLPPAIRQHRLLEPLIWLRQNGVQLPTRGEEQPWGKVRRLIETDLSHPWRVTDRIVQRAMLMAMEPIWESDFHRLSYGFRPERSVHHAVRTVRIQLQDGADTTRGRWIIEGDLASYFDTVHHRLLLRCVRRRVQDGRFVDLLQRFLKAAPRRASR